MSMAIDDSDLLLRIEDAPDGACISDFACTPREALNWIAGTKILRDMIARVIIPTYYSAALILADMILDGHGDRPRIYVEIWTGEQRAEGAEPLMSGWGPDDEAFKTVMNGYSRAAAAQGFMSSRERLIETYKRRFKSDATAYADIREALVDLGLIPADVESEAA